METTDPREAGRSIAKAFHFLTDTNREISELLGTLDKLLGGLVPSWQSPEWNVTWYVSQFITNPERWNPWFFLRVWMKRRDGGNWMHAIAVWIYLDVPADGGCDEPWVGCFLLEAIPEEGTSSWLPWWFMEMDRLLTVKYAPGLVNRAMEWSDPTDAKKMPVRMCGYYLKLTDIKSEEDLDTLVVKPLLALEDGWEVAKLPPLPKW